jgi:Kef-type K+ transport system membrane component KefB
VSNFELSVRLFLQLAVILIACRVVGMLGRRVGQPQVVGEMIAGVALGPSLFGHLAPALHGWIFPKESMSVLYCLSQIGLVLYMFLVGVDFRADLLRRRLHSAISVSMAGILAPMALGALIAVWLNGEVQLFAPGVSTVQAMLFLGAAMSITAFPMLARIIYERGLSGTSFGTLALAAGSLDDAFAWCLLAVVLASFSGNAAIAVIAIGGGALYAAGVLTLGRPLLRRLEQTVEDKGKLEDPVLCFVLILVMLGAWTTDAVGIYAVFGAFFLGAAVRQGSLLANELRRLLEPLTAIFLLPLFFVYSGLNTRIGLVDTPFLVLVTAVVLLAACMGKGVACWAAARLNGEGSFQAVAVGALMNARGLMELIILNIGLERGIITPTLFSIMVIMAVVTTLMATPTFEFVQRRALAPAPAVEARAA